MEGTHSEKEGKTKKISKAKLREIKKKIELSLENKNRYKKIKVKIQCKHASCKNSRKNTESFRIQSLESATVYKNKTHLRKLLFYYQVACRFPLCFIYLFKMAFHV